MLISSWKGPAAWTLRLLGQVGAANCLPISTFPLFPNSRSPLHTTQMSTLFPSILCSSGSPEPRVPHLHSGHMGRVTCMTSSCSLLPLPPHFLPDARLTQSRHILSRASQATSEAGEKRAGASGRAATPAQHFTEKRKPCRLALIFGLCDQVQHLALTSVVLSAISNNDTISTGRQRFL